MHPDYPELILAIHNDFDSASDKIVAEANAILSNPILTKKPEVLNDLGFSGSSEFKQFKERQKIIEFNNNVIAAINSLKVKYPFHKAINLDTVKEICKKYRLVYGDSSLYKGFIPAKNLKEIENFKKSYPKDFTRYVKAHLFTGNVEDISQETYLAKKDNPGLIYVYKEVKRPLLIVAPISDMDMRGKVTVEYKITNAPVPKDPIVLLPVKEHGVDLYLIITKWGLEASDPALNDYTMN